MELDKTMLDELTSGCKTPQDVEKLFSQMLQHMINRSLEAEMQAHGPCAAWALRRQRAQWQNRKTVQSALGELQIETPRDRAGTFAPRW
ncbi:transposase [Xanthomonas oryzae]|nr:transposase [Xanthomonas oryzae]